MNAYSASENWTIRSSSPDVFCKKGFLRNFAKLTVKHLCQGVFLKEVVGLRPATLFKKILRHRCFPINFAKFLRTPFITGHLRWLLLDYFFDINSLKNSFIWYDLIFFLNAANYIRVFSLILESDIDPGYINWTQLLNINSNWRNSNKGFPVCV